MDKIDQEISEEYEQVRKYLDLCSAGLITLTFESDERMFEARFCGSKRMAIQMPDSTKPAQGSTWVDIEQIMPHDE